MSTTKLMPIAEMRRLFEGATPGPWVGCNHVRNHAFDAECKCNQATVWSEFADTIVVDKYVNDGSGPEPVGRLEELRNMSFIAAARTQWPLAVEWMERARALLSRIYLLDVSCHEAATSIESLLEELPE